MQLLQIENTFKMFKTGSNTMCPRSIANLYIASSYKKWPHISLCPIAINHRLTLTGNKGGKHPFLRFFALYWRRTLQRNPLFVMETAVKKMVLHPYRELLLQKILRLTRQEFWQYRRFLFLQKIFVKTIWLNILYSYTSVCTICPRNIVTHII